FSQSKKQCSRTTLHIYIITTTYAVWFSYVVVVVFHFTRFPTARKLCVSIHFHDTRDVKGETSYELQTLHSEDRDQGFKKLGLTRRWMEVL
ncbi:hypothetical protein VIGAN_07083800, partial [Vigna angularis var. angularis]